MIDNALYYGDNLDILRRYVKDESVDLVYLDPPLWNAGTRSCSPDCQTRSDDVDSCT